MTLSTGTPHSAQPSSKLLRVDLQMRHSTLYIRAVKGLCNALSETCRVEREVKQSRISISMLKARSSDPEHQAWTRANTSQYFRYHLLREPQPYDIQI